MARRNRVAMTTVRAIYENGVFRPTEPIDLPEHSLVEFEPRTVGDVRREKALDAVYEILSRRYESGRHDLAERHDEHQP
jgi:predicted DNA-binding antitoxin AbrB/MazE fold protein